MAGSNRRVFEAMMMIVMFQSSPIQGLFRGYRDVFTIESELVVFFQELFFLPCLIHGKPH
jgi:hypothetical protein